MKLAKNYRLKLSKDDNYVVEYGEKFVNVYGAQNRDFVNNFRHPCQITCLEIQGNNEFIAVGDKIGKTTIYY